MWETPDTIQTLLSYPNDVQAHFEGTFSNARGGAYIEFMGTDATLYIDRGRFELIPEARSKQKPEDMILGKGPRGRDFYEQPDGELLHLQNWVDAIRNSRQPSAPIAAGARNPDHSSHTNIEFAGFFEEYFSPATPISRCASAGKYSRSVEIS